jgi:hypothetical protein
MPGDDVVGVVWLAGPWTGAGDEGDATLGAVLGSVADGADSDVVVEPTGACVFSTA